ncbi:glycosyltransferase [Mediterraneibacter glycyrrhizinilyticus]|uniref:glycosyltransferase n=1 Tax=Mediterraneibacter glycyrrhizinilyticus TaxID=342942 RepID=UPI00265A4903|nr:glycosyltransferase [Mediterraneibacter glycyrrhizinilyticus]MCF2570136.1 glycosyltransferase [Mediterraneibacter glycyrrhizinilyticus]
MEKKISVVIPVYNVEKYLAECLDSVIGQSFRDIEIICVNDGSKDGSRDILAAYAKKDSRIVIFDKTNGGLSSARNTGLDAATGKYVLFLDSDDLLHASDALSVLYQKAEDNSLEQLFFDAEVIFENDDVKEKNSNYIDYYKRKNNYEDITAGRELFSMLQSNWDFKPNACMQFFLRSFLTDNELTFCENILHEDEVFTLECVALSKRAAYINMPCLIRRIRDNSIMTTAQKAGSIYGYYYGIRKLIDFAEQHLSIMEEPFAGFYLQRIGVMMELAGRLYYKENETEKKQVAAGIKDRSKFEFAADMLAWEKIVSLKERLQYYITEKKSQQEKLKAAQNKIQNLSEQLKKEKETTAKIRKELSDELNIEKRKLEHIKKSTSYKVGRAVTWAPRKMKRVFKDNKEINKRKVYLIGTPEFGNLGDHMISETELEMLRTIYPMNDIREITMNEYWNVKEHLKEIISENDLLVFHGGGNVGNLWPKSEYIRRDAFSVWYKQKKIVMPQSICFTDDEDGEKELEESRKAYKVPNLLLCCRDEASYRFAQKTFPCDSLYVPDTVMFHKPLLGNREKSIREGAILCLRNDKEKALTEQEKTDIINIVSRKYSKVEELDTVGEKMTRETRKEGLRRFFDRLCAAEIVVTDRLHGMIFCALEGIPCIAMDNSYQKVLGAYKWLETLDYIHYITNVKELSKWIDYSWKENYVYPYKKYREKFEPLLQKLQKQ